MVSSTLRRGFAAKAVAVACVALAFAALGASGAVAHKGGTNRPIKGTVSGTNVFDLSTGSSVQDLKGTESHLGRVTAHQTGTLTFTGPNSFNVSGTGVLTAANGDELFTAFSGSGTTDSALNVQGHTAITITGGTGRFTGASGAEAGTFSAPPGVFSGPTLTSTLTISIKGAISY